MEPPGLKERNRPINPEVTEYKEWEQTLFTRICLCLALILSMSASSAGAQTHH